MPGYRAFAADVVDLEIDVSSEMTINATHHIADSKQLVLWLPSERGISAETSPIANAIADLGIDVWMVDLHGSYMVATSRNSIKQFLPEDILDLIEVAGAKGYREIYFASSSRGVRLVLDSIYEFGSRYPISNLVKGSIFFHPNVFAPVTALGQVAGFVEGSGTSHLPIYMIQSEFSTKYVYRQLTRRQLERGGSQVFLHILPEVESGFFARPGHELSSISASARTRLPAIIDNAVQLLSGLAPGQLSVSREKEDNVTTNRLSRETGLHAFRGDRQKPELSLVNLEGIEIDLNDYKGRVVLVNFWASWCKPCVDEIPSLARLSGLYDEGRFAVLTINIGESRQRVTDFLSPLNTGFSVLLDEDGSAARDWRVYAFPSNFLIDKNGLIQYSYSGALEWDSQEVLEIIETLL